ncbi:MAG: DUF58 domain-containing protein [Myxococcaceae bacterium]
MALLTAETLARLSGVKLRARTLMEGVLSGLHKSPLQGQSVEFAEHKEYSPGDELRHLDWKVFGKFDRYYVKRFEHETHLRAFLVVDTSGSMSYASGALSKLEAAAALAGALCYLLVRQQDAVGVTLVSGDALVEIPARASAGHLAPLLEALESAHANGPTDLARAAELVAERAGRRSFVGVFSDFLEPSDAGFSRLLQLRARRHDVAFFHLLDAAEIMFPFQDPMLFLDTEGDARVEVNARDIAESYREEFEQFLHETRRRCAESDVDYTQVRTDAPLDVPLLRFMMQRQRGRP